MRHYPIPTLLGMLIVVYQHHQPRAVILTRTLFQISLQHALVLGIFKVFGRRNISRSYSRHHHCAFDFLYPVGSESLRAAGHISQSVRQVARVLGKSRG